MDFLLFEIRIFFTALMFYTRIPCPSWVDHDPKFINLSVRYFPLVGFILGSLVFLAFWFFALILPVSIAALLAIGVSVLLTGAFHEDGFADVCDGFGGGWTKEKILEIMKDSRLGTYGTIGLLLTMALKWAIWEALAKPYVTTLPLAGFLLIVNLYTWSRWGASIMVFTHEYVREENESKSKPIAIQTNVKNLWIGLVVPILVLAALIISTNQWFYMGIIPAVLLVYLYFSAYFKKWIGGYTGDCLGAIQHCTELAIGLMMVGIHFAFRA